MANTVKQTIQFRNEHDFQAHCVKWFWNTYHWERRLLHANNNNSVNAVAGNKAKVLGVVAGVSDLELVADHGKVFFIELKMPGNKQSIEQEDFEQKIRKLGHTYVIFETFEEFKQLVETIYGTR